MKIKFHLRRFLPITVLFFLFFAACTNNDGQLINGTSLPDIELPDSLDKKVKLSSLKGNLVLVEFWASWCKPCRIKHPELNRIYNKFKGKPLKGGENGFEIYYVSLDSYKTLWLNALKKDGIENWQYHVADLVGMKKSTLPLSFQFTQVPTSFLIDENGIIIGKDLTENRLEFELNERLKGE